MKTKARTTTRKAKSDTKAKVDVYQIVTDQVIDLLNAGTAPWHKPWSTVSGGLPKSLSTRKPYRGINVLLLGIAALENGYRSPWWGTYDHIGDLGGQVRRGEHGTLITFWRSFMSDETDPATGDPVRVKRFVLRYYKVFNADQADWPEGKEPAAGPVQTEPGERIDAAEKVVVNYPSPPTIRQNGSSAFYTAGRTDTVTVPPLKAYTSVDEYYSTLFHELTHSTGHDSRLAREGIKAGTYGPFGSPVYSKEELVAEMGSAMLCAITGINTTVTLPNSAAYLQSWINVLKGDSRLIVHAAAQAQHAVDHILGEHFDGDENGESS